jgi:hypothetical protein
MADEKITAPKFSGNEDDYALWWMRALAYAERFKFGDTMSSIAEADLPATEGPGTSVDEIAAVERNTKAVAFLMQVIPDSVLIGMRAAGTNTDWPKKPKAHLMIAHLQKSYQEQTACMAKVGAKRDLEKCVMKKEENPKFLFERLVNVQFKYQGHPTAGISEDEAVAQAIQALPSQYNPTVAGLVGGAQPLTMDALKTAIGTHYSIAMKGVTREKVKEIEGGLAAMEEVMQVQEDAGNLKDNLKRLIQETLTTTIHEYHVKHQGGHGMGGGGGGFGLAAIGQPSVAPQVASSSNGMTAEMVMALIQAAVPGHGTPAIKPAEPAQIDQSTMICYQCGQFGHRSNECKNPKNHALAAQVLKAQGRKPCEHCGRFGHPPNLCWNLDANAHLRPPFWTGPVYTPEYKAEHGLGGIDDDLDSTSELSFVLANMSHDELESMNASLRAMGLSLSSPDVWIGDTGATTHNTAYIAGAVNQRKATAQDNIVGVTGALAEAKTIVDIPCVVSRNGVQEKLMMKDVTYAPNSRYNLFSLTKLMTKGWTMSGDKSVGIKMTKGKRELHFDKTVHTPKGVLYVVVMKRRESEERERRGSWLKMKTNLEVQRLK